MSEKIAVECAGVSKLYDKKRVLDNVSFTAETGEIFSIIGPSAAGKTTLLRILAALEKPDKGSVKVLGIQAYKNPASDIKIRKTLGYIQQKTVMLRGTIRENIALPLKMRGYDEAEIKTRVEDVASQHGIADILKKSARKVSGGEAQRAAFARSTVFGPKVLLLDEFTANLDPANSEILEKAVMDFRAKGGCVVLVSHNILQVKRLGDRVGILIGGKMIETGNVKDVFSCPKNELTGKFLSGEMVW